MIENDGFWEVEDVIRFHEEQIELFGGESGILKMDALESAVNAPRHASYYGDKEDDLAESAAILLCRLALNHAFNDGNKRVAAVSAVNFLEYYGAHVELSNKALEELVLRVISHDLSEQQVATIFETQSGVLPVEKESPSDQQASHLRRVHQGLGYGWSRTFTWLNSAGPLSSGQSSTLSDDDPQTTT